MSFDHFLVWLSNKLRHEPNHQFPKPGDLVLGMGMERDESRPLAFIPHALRPQHLGIVGLSGSGKTYLIEYMIRSDVENNNGVAVFDLHGDLADNIINYLAEIAPFRPEVYERTIIIEPFDKERSFGFNPLQVSGDTSAHLQAKEFTSILRSRLEGDKLSPRMSELLHSSLYTLSVNDETLLGISELLTKEKVRAGMTRKLAGNVKDYWERYNGLSERMQSSFREPILTRLSSFITDPKIRHIIGQKKSTFSFKGAIQNGHWVIINLSKGRLGEENSTILGSMLFRKLELDIMSMANVPEKERRLFAVYADELQNLTGDTFGRLIAEARKYKIALTAGHQFWRQLEPSLRNAMRAVGSKVFFRLHHQDAMQLASELTASEKDRYVRRLTVLGRGEAVVRIGRGKPMSISIPQYKRGKPTEDELEELRCQSGVRNTILRSDVEAQMDIYENGLSKGIKKTKEEPYGKETEE